MTTPTPTPERIKPLAAAMTAVKTALMTRANPTADRAAEQLGTQVTSLRAQHDAIEADIADIDNLMRELAALKLRRTEELSDVGRTLNEMIAARANLERV